MVNNILFPTTNKKNIKFEIYIMKEHVSKGHIQINDIRQH